MGKCENYFADFVITIEIAAIQIGGNSYEASTSCIIKSDFDDGSMSIYFGATIFCNSRKPYSYLNIEAGGKDDVHSWLLFVAARSLKKNGGALEEKTANASADQVLCVSQRRKETYSRIRSHLFLSFYPPMLHISKLPQMESMIDSLAANLASSVPMIIT